MNGKIYVFGGENDSGYLSSVEEYDPATDLWTPRADMSIARAQHVVLAGANGKIYAIGGRNSSVHLSLVEEYDPQTDSWAVRADMPTPRRASGAAEVNGIIYVIGGMSYDSPTSAVEAYDPSTDTWTSRTDMPIAQEGITATSLDNHIYVIGGVYELTTVEVYNPELNSWTAGHDINNGRHNPAAVSMGEKIYVIGGVHSYSCGYACVEENHTPNILNTRIQNLTLINGGITVPGYSQIVSSQISGGITAGSGSVVSETTLGGSIQYEGYGISQNNFAKGSITIGSGEVLSNTLQGGIIAGDGSIIQGNNVENSSPWGWSIQTSGNVTIQGNRLAGSAAGIYASDGTIQGNLVANSAGVGLYIMGDANVISNTFTANLSNTIVIQSGAPTIQGNNLEGNSGTFDIQNLTANDIQAQGNWWGTTEESMISQRIYDYNDDYTLGYVVYPPVADGPIQDAPAYVRSVTVDPNPAGIETATFEVEFSKPMDVETIPQLSFQSPLNNTWTVFNTSNSELPADNVYSSASDADGSVWFGTEGGGVAKFDGTTWTVYNTTNSGLPNDTVSSILVDPDGSYWFGTGYGVAHFDGTTWTVYNTTNSGLPTDSVTSIANDPDGSHWFGTQGGVAHFDGTTWTVHNTVNSGLPNDSITSIATDPNGSHWFGTHGGVAHFDDTTWTAYDLYNSGLPDNYVTTILSDPDGSHWFGTMGMGLAHFDGTTWTVYTTSNSGIPSDAVVSITIDTDGSYWFGSYGNGVAHFDGTNWTVYSTTNSELPENYVMTIDTDTDGSHWFGTLNGGVGVLWNYPPYVVQDNPQWLDDSHFRASFDITSLIPRGDYRITVADALGTDSIQIAPNSAFTFTVDYAGGVGDTTAPGLPSVTACAGATLDSLSASWSASDPDSEITLYQYAIGTSPGATDVINWTFTDQTSVDLDGLTLTPGQLYYISVKARNAGGLWSEAATPDGMLPGSGVCTTSGFMAYLSLVSK
jgi:ligand-binding sensor domain-containing protein